MRIGTAIMIDTNGFRLIRTDKQPPAKFNACKQISRPAMLESEFRQQRKHGEFHLKISREDVVRVAELAYLDLSESELETYRAQVDEILEYIGKLNELDTENVEPMAQVLSDDQTADATLRDDVVVPCGIAAEVLKQAPDPEPPFFRVPKVIDR